MKNIIVIEDEQSIADTIVHCIEREGYAATWCNRGLEGLERVKSGGYALVVLDVGLPDINGFELCKAIRSFSSVPIIFLTARDDEIDTIVGLEIGGDDYMTKPFSPRELGARIKTVLRRISDNAGPSAMSGGHLAPALAPDAPAHTSAHTPGQTPGHLPEQASGPMSGPDSEKAQTPPAGTTLCIDREKMQVLYRGKRLELTRYEFKLLALLAAHPGRVYSREALMQNIWDSDSPSLDRTVDAHIKSLRAKCREIDPERDPVLTHRGTGYALRDDL